MLFYPSLPAESALRKVKHVLQATEQNKQNLPKSKLIIYYISIKVLNLAPS